MSKILASVLIVTFLAVTAYAADMSKTLAPAITSTTVTQEPAPATEPSAKETKIPVPGTLQAPLLPTVLKAPPRGRTVPQERTSLTPIGKSPGVALPARKNPGSLLPDQKRSAPGVTLKPMLKPVTAALPGTAPADSNTPMVDFEPYEITFSRSPQNIDVWVLVFNKGQDQTPPTQVTLTLREKPLPQNQNPPVTYVATGVLAPIEPVTMPSGIPRAKVATFAVPVAITSGFWQWEASVDSNNTVQETDETNNSIIQFMNPR
jgi:hypothetical protein